MNDETQKALEAAGFKVGTASEFLGLDKIETFLISRCTIWGENKTWKDWFEDVLLTLLVETESFSGKRPNCNSGWAEKLADALAEIDPLIVDSWEDEDGNKIPYGINWTRYKVVCKDVLKKIFK